MNPAVKDYLLNVTQATACEEVEVIQSLWSGYGKISRYELLGAPFKTVVIKFISPNPTNGHPRGWNTDLSHNRKVQSYVVETYWYREWNQECTDECKTAKYIGSFSTQKERWIILEDLNIDYPLRKYQIELSEIKICLKWLANFHSTFLTKRPEGLWEIGTYWHLGTRPDEFEKIEHPTLKSKAHEIDQILNQSKYQTIVHGDAKLANFCFSEDGTKVAAVDFQYVGGGCGMKDVAYFLGSCLSSSECQRHEKELLDYYFLELRDSFIDASHNFTFNELEQEWRRMYPFACTDFTRFMLGWMPTHQKINDYNLRMMDAVLGRL